MKHRPLLHPQDIEKFSQEQYLEAFECIKNGTIISGEESHEQDIHDIILGIRYFRRKYSLQTEKILDMKQMIDSIIKSPKDFIDMGIIVGVREQISLKEETDILEGRYMQALNNSAAVQIIDADGIIQYVNNLYREISWDKRDLVGKMAKAMGGSKYHTPEFWKDMWDVILSGKVWKWIIKNPRMDGEGSYYSHTTITPTVGDDGEYSEFMAIKFDVTELYETRETLINFIDRVHKILNSTSQWYWVIDEGLNILDINDGFCIMTGYDRSEIIGKSIYDFFDVESKKILRMQTHTIKDTEHRTYDLKLLRKDGINLPIKLQATTMRDTHGNITDIVAFVTDVSNIYEATTKDVLTAISNRGSFDSELTECYTLMKEGELDEISIAMIDIDHFKHINDRYGHPVWDIVLRKMWSMLRSLSDSNKNLFVYRYGWEEFVVIWRGMNTDFMKGIMEGFRIEIENIEIISDGGKIKLTISAGVAGYKVWDTYNNTPEKITNLADVCLYAAKQDGRNCVKTRRDM